jgi:hypothetical protein
MSQQRSLLSPSTSHALGVWAAQRRELLLSKEEPLSCTLARIRDERWAAGAPHINAVDAVRRQRTYEIHRGDGVAVQAVVVVLPEIARACLVYYWVLKPMHVVVREQAEAIGITLSIFWKQLTVAETCVDVGLQLVGQRPQGCTCGAASGSVTSGARAPPVR